MIHKRIALMLLALGLVAPSFVSTVYAAEASATTVDQNNGKQGGNKEEEETTSATTEGQGDGKEGKEGGKEEVVDTEDEKENKAAAQKLAEDTQTYNDKALDTAIQALKDAAKEGVEQNAQHAETLQNKKELLTIAQKEQKVLTDIELLDSKEKFNAFIARITDPNTVENQKITLTKRTAQALQAKGEGLDDVKDTQDFKAFVTNTLAPVIAKPVGPQGGKGGMTLGKITLATVIAAVVTELGYTFKYKNDLNRVERIKGKKRSNYLEALRALAEYQYNWTASKVITAQNACTGFYDDVMSDDEDLDDDAE